MKKNLRNILVIKMIRIDTIKIDNWEEIKKRHKYWYNSKVFDLMNTAIVKFSTIIDDEIIAYKNLLKTIISHENIAILEIEDFLGLMKLSNLEILEINKLFFKKNKKEKSILEKALDNHNLYEFYPEKIFNYTEFSKITSPNWGRREFLNLLGLETCPYCQRAYVTNFQDDEGKNTTADLDHFYPKSKYPYLALSLYNFVPSCKFCNSTGRKGDVDTYENPHIYPYTDSMEEDIKFTIEANSFVDNVFTRNQNLNIDIDVISTDIEKNKKIENSLKTFKLKEVYKNSHSKYVGDLIHNFQKYPKSYTKALGEIFLDKDEEFKIYQEKLQILNDNFQEIIKKPYTDKIKKGEPLAKLTKDIMEELGIK